MPSATEPGVVTLTMAEGFALLRDRGLDVAPFVSVGHPGELTPAVLASIGRPVAVKLDDPAVAHKSRAGLVVLGCESDDEIRAAAATVVERRRAVTGQDAGVLIQEMVRGGPTEFLVGFQRDPVVGACVLVGSGGVLVELLADGIAGVLPAGRAELARMIGAVRSTALLDSVDAGASVEALITLVERAAAWFEQDESVLSVDLNPVLVSRGAARLVDVVVERSGAPGTPSV